MYIKMTPVRMVEIKTQVTAHAGKDVEEGEHSSLDGRNKTLYNHFENQYGGFSEKWE